MTVKRRISACFGDAAGADYTHRLLGELGNASSQNDACRTGGGAGRVRRLGTRSLPAHRQASRQRGAHRGRTLRICGIAGRHHARAPRVSRGPRRVRLQSLARGFLRLAYSAQFRRRNPLRHRRWTPSAREVECDMVNQFRARKRKCRRTTRRALAWRCRQRKVMSMAPVPAAGARNWARSPRRHKTKSRAHADNAGDGLRRPEASTTCTSRPSRCGNCGEWRDDYPGSREAANERPSYNFAYLDEKWMNSATRWAIAIPARCLSRREMPLKERGASLASMGRATSSR